MESSTSLVKPAYEGSYVLSVEPMVAYLDDFLGAQECLHIIEVARNRLKRARVSRKGDESLTNGRTNSNAWVSHNTDSIILKVATRISDLIGIPLENAEALQVIHYGVDQEYKAHFDAYDLSKDLGRHYTRRGGQRLVTTLTYLNDVEEGGGTSFPKLGLEIEAHKGRLAIFHNCLVGSTAVHPKSLHSGMPVARGEKWAFNLWFHERALDGREVRRRVKRTTQTSDVKWALRINRAERLFKVAYESLPIECCLKQGRCVFTYWDEYGNNQLDTSGIPEDVPVYRLIKRPILNRLSDKASLAKAIKDHDLNDVAPVTYLTRDEALQHTGEPVKIWFIKNAYGTAGKGMHCVTHEALHEHEIPERFIVQAAIEGIELIGGRKFTTRIYALIWNGHLFLYRNGFNIVHGVFYVESSTDYAVQIEHAGYQKRDAPVKMHPLVRYEKYAHYYPAMVGLVRRLRPVLASCLEASSEERYALLGIDVMLLESGEVRLIEINTVPNFMHTAEINIEVNVPFIRAAIRRMLDVPGDEGMLVQVG